MPPRRSHRKSHNGCLQCKRRHVKCDEIRPRCGPCAKRELTCHFQSTQVSDNGQPGSPGSSTETAKDKLHTPLPARTLELKLLHHFTSQAYLTLMPKSEEHSRHWRVDIPSLALDNTFLLDALLALSALHLAHLEVGTRKLWLQSALRYQDLALAGLNKALSNMSPESCEAVAMCSILVLMLSIAIPGVCDDANETSRNPISDLLGIRKLMEGVSIITRQSEVVLSNGVLKEFFRPLLLPDYRFILPEITASGPEELLLARHRPLADRVAESIRELQRLVSSRPAVYQTDLSNACQSLEKIVAPLSAVSAVISWPLGISPSIFTLLEQNDDLAYLLMIHYGIVLHLITDWWFTKDAGKRLIRALLSSSVVVDDYLKPTIVWARALVGIADERV